MDETIIDFIRAKRIDSFQKLRLLLLLYERPGLNRTSHECAHQLSLANLPFLEEIIGDLRLAGLLDCVDGCFKLRNDPGIRSCLGYLARAFSNPLDRQGILDLVTRSRFSGRYLEDAYELH